MKHTSKSKVDWFHKAFKKHKNSCRSVGWGSDESVRIRYDSLLKKVPVDGLKVLDIGCGLGHLYEHACDSGQSPRQWLGIEVLPQFVKSCETRFRHSDNFSVWHGDFLDSVELSSGKHFHLATLMGSISLVHPDRLSRWVKMLDTIWDIDCFMIEFLREGIAKGPFYKYNLPEVREFFDRKSYPYEVVFHELPHVFTIYAWPRKKRRSDNEME